MPAFPLHAAVRGAAFVRFCTFVDTLPIVRYSMHHRTIGNILMAQFSFLTKRALALCLLFAPRAFLFSEELSLPQESTALAESIESAEQAEAPSSLITEIRVAGLKKTRESHIQTLLKKYRGIPQKDLDIHAVETTLQQIGLFEKYTVAVENAESGDAVLVITVKEKLSFIPLPFAMYSDGSAMGGGIIMDTNAFGVQDMFMFGGFFSKSLLMGMANFSKPSLGFTKPGFSFGGSGSKKTSTFTNLDREKILVYDATSCSVHAAVSDRLTEHSSASLGVSYSQSAIDKEDEYEAFDAESYKALTVTASWGMSTADWNGYFLSTKGLSVNGALRFYDDSFSQAASAKLAVEQPLFSPRLRFVGHTSGALWHNEYIFQLGDGSSLSVAILPGDFHSAKLLGASGGLEFAFAKARWALFSLYASYQAAYSEDSDSTMRFTHGGTGGMRMYLSKIAFPALAFGVSYNVSLAHFKYTAAFGVSM